MPAPFFIQSMVPYFLKTFACVLTISFLCSCQLGIDFSKYEGRYRVENLSENPHSACAHLDGEEVEVSVETHPETGELLYAAVENSKLYDRYLFQWTKKEHSKRTLKIEDGYLGTEINTRKRKFKKKKQTNSISIINTEGSFLFVGTPHIPGALSHSVNKSTLTFLNDGRLFLTGKEHFSGAVFGIIPIAGEDEDQIVKCLLHPLK